MCASISSFERNGSMIAGVPCGCTWVLGTSTHSFRYCASVWYLGTAWLLLPFWTPLLPLLLLWHKEYRLTDLLFLSGWWLLGYPQVWAASPLLWLSCWWERVLVFESHNRKACVIALFGGWDMQKWFKIQKELYFNYRKVCFCFLTVSFSGILLYLV